MKKLIVLLLIMISLPLFTSAYAKEAAPTGSGPGALPEIFSPLTWDMNIRKLKKLFPATEHFETSYTSPSGEIMISSMVYGFELDPFGDVHVSVAHHNYKRIDIINMTTTETRPECFETLPAPDWCRTSYNYDLVKTLENLKEIISKAYGPPLEYKGGYREAAGLPPDPREKGNKWELDGYNLFLTMTVGEEDDWAVGLQAVRREEPPRAAAPQEIGWVGLWNEEMLEWVENENRIYSLCPKSMGRDSYEKCRRDNLAEKRWIVPAYNSPENTSEMAGEIIIAVEPGSPFIASFKDTGGTIMDFEPDLYVEDWGYGPYFHQTILEKKEDWIKIPLGSLETPVWINPEASIKHLDIINIAEGHVYMLGAESIFITKIEGDVISFRLEHPSDMWCDEGEPPELEASETKKININELYDTNKHLKLDIKYKRGC